MAITSAKDATNQVKIPVNTNGLYLDAFRSLAGTPATSLLNYGNFGPQSPGFRTKAQAIALQEPQKKFHKINLVELGMQPKAIQDLVKEYEPIDAFINKTGDRMVLNLTGDSIRDNLFETGFISVIANALRKFFGYETTSVGLEEYKKLFYVDGNHQGESPDTLIKNLKHSTEKKGGHYYGQASFKLENGKFQIDTITITDSAYFAAKQLISQGLVPEDTNLAPFEKTFFIKYIIPVRADFRTTKISEKTSEIIDTLISNKAEQFDTFYVVGSPQESALKNHHSFKSLPWKFPLVDDSGKWTHIDGHLFVVRHISNPIVFPEGTAEVLPEMQTAYGGEARHPDKKFFQTCVDFNKLAFSQN